MAMLGGDGSRAGKLLTLAQRLRPHLTYAIPHLAVQARLELIRTLLSLADVAGARTVLREIDDILRLRPRLGVLPEQVKALRAQINSTPLGTIGVSALTAAELRLLPLLQTHLTFREIGERLFVSSHTIKTQAISIYRKLGVSSRSEAMRRASQIGLLPH
jgi:LuxR family maltose regulon positive regulatory protein